MLKLFNTYTKQIEIFHPVNKKMVTIFTCGPSIYQRAHIGNFRTFLFEDVLVRYLRYSGFKVKRGMTITDIEDKAVSEALRREVSLKNLTDTNIQGFTKEMDLLRMGIPEYLPRSSDYIEAAVDIIEKLLALKRAYWDNGNVYFAPLTFPGFGKLYGLDMTHWPSQKRRFHRDTYPGMRWNRGDFILWHGYKEGEKNFWDTRIGKGRPSWNVQDPSMVSSHFNETLSCYCGGIDNLIRHHDYSCAILESIRPYPMARFWLHCHHLYVDGKKMSKSMGNIYYIETLTKKGYSISEVRFFLIYRHYREKLNYSERAMVDAAEKLRALKKSVHQLQRKAKRMASYGDIARKITQVFTERMDNDLDVRGAFDVLQDILSGVGISGLKRGDAYLVVKALKEVDEVLQVIF